MKRMLGTTPSIFLVIAIVSRAFVEGWNPSHKPTDLRSAEQFATGVNSRFPEFDYTENEYVDPEEITRAVFKVLANYITPGEIEDVVACLPKGLKELWS